jgi:AraC-like DNA-binding protein
MESNKIEKYHFQKDRPQQRQFDVYDLKSYYQKNANHSSKPHTHSFYQIIWFKNDHGKHTIDFVDHPIKSNRLFFISKNQIHFFEDRDDYEGYVLHFNESFILSNETDFNFFLTYNIFNNKETPFFQPPAEIQDLVQTYLSQIVAESLHRESFGNKKILSHLLKSLLLTIEREQRKSLGTNAIRLDQNNTFLQFRDLLEKNYDQHLSVSDYADKLSISSKTLNALVKTETQKTVSTVIADRIILEAKRKLIHSNAFANQIAYDLGFKDPYYFIKYFKKHVTCSPSEFRKLNS